MGVDGTQPTIIYKTANNCGWMKLVRLPDGMYDIQEMTPTGMFYEHRSAPITQGQLIENAMYWMFHCTYIEERPYLEEMARGIREYVGENQWALAVLENL